ncbi:RNA polymerase II C-terminal domain phosphatase-like 1 [Cucumis melo var. makuwa]|uniref:RNA polymerase II C-terminal domain phosphatase-like 1 n=1 Tax=Cucumis melo var. makuwa TaxID=1194695 RepID=A0A5D3BW36_CUCMM|nr:RNA polymerase II C-terminal domain phosphatase-like 1 [Cucumis melo var. makuwa]
MLILFILRIYLLKVFHDFRFKYCPGLNCFDTNVMELLLVQHPFPALTEEFELQLKPESVLGIRWNGQIAVNEWLVKWKGLPDSEATWERVTEMKQQFPSFHLEDKILEGRHRFGFLIEEIPHPTPEDHQEGYWKGEDSLIWSILINSMEPQIGKPLLDRIQYCSRIEEVDRKYVCLASLNPKFDIVHEHILSQRPIPSLIKNCFEIHLENDRASAMSSPTIPAIEPAAFSARSPSHDSEKHNGKLIPVCEHCKKHWHTKEQCLKLHGCPPGGKKRPSNNKQDVLM